MCLRDRIYPSQLSDDHFWVAAFRRSEELPAVTIDIMGRRQRLLNQTLRNFLWFCPDGPVKMDGWHLDAVSRRQALNSTPVPYTPLTLPTTQPLSITVLLRCSIYKPI